MLQVERLEAKYLAHATTRVPLQAVKDHCSVICYFIKYSIDLYRCGTGHLYVSILDKQVYI